MSWWSTLPLVISLLWFSPWPPSMMTSSLEHTSTNLSAAWNIWILKASLTVTSNVRIFSSLTISSSKSATLTSATSLKMATNPLAEGLRTSEPLKLFLAMNTTLSRLIFTQLLSSCLPWSMESSLALKMMNLTSSSCRSSSKEIFKLFGKRPDLFMFVSCVVFPYCCFAWLIC